MIDLTFLSKLIGLAITDAVNPCELAILTMVLMALLLNEPTKKKNVLLGGLALTSAVFILYFLYGFIIVQFFKHIIPATGFLSLYIFKGFGVIAIVLGLMNIKDYLRYSPGGIATEMPLSWRPRAKMMIKKISTPKGAFLVGLLITFFLLPCTAGPYLIFSGQAAQYELSAFELIFSLLFYNLIFVLPMIAITLGIYFGVTTVDKVSSWKEQNIKRLHLTEGIILILLGIAMVTGLI